MSALPDLAAERRRATNREKQQRWRDRQKAKRACLEVETDETKLSEELERLGYLLKHADHTRNAVTAALSKALDIMIRDYDPDEPAAERNRDRLPKAP